MYPVQEGTHLIHILDGTVDFIVTTIIGIQDFMNQGIM